MVSKKSTRHYRSGTFSLFSFQQNSRPPAYSFLSLLLPPEEASVGGRPHCAVELLPTPDFWVLPWLFHATFGKLAMLCHISPHPKQWPVMLLHGPKCRPKCWRPHWSHVFFCCHWAGCLPLSCFFRGLNLLKFLFPCKLDPPGSNFLFAWPFFRLNFSLIHDSAIFTALWYISWKLA